MPGAARVSVQVETRGLEALIAYFESLPEKADEASIFAVNEGARYGQTQGSKGIRDQVAFSARYIGSANDGASARLGIIKRARSGDVEAIVRGRERPTSLARFAVGSKVVGRRTPGRPVRVKVAARGGAVTMPGAWLMRLRQGTRLDDESFNVGLAVRLKPGQTLNKREFASSKGRNGLHVLYGPSVAQVFRDVARDLQGPVSARVENEFIRQFERLK